MKRGQEEEKAKECSYIVIRMGQGKESRFTKVIQRYSLPKTREIHQWEKKKGQYNLFI